MSETLYERDFFVWTREQGAALRTRHGGANALDWDNLAEEIESLGRSERATVFSYVRLIIEHFYKLATSRNDLPRNKWRGEIRTFRDDMSRRTTTTILNEVEESLEELHERAASIVQDQMAEHGEDVVVEAGRRWTLEQILGQADDPLTDEFKPASTTPA